jgi:ribosomal protein S18 acetylase RimI-like enzyme
MSGDHYSTPVVVEAAQAGELEAAFQLVFQQHDTSERDVRITNALKLVRQRELDPAGVIVARSQNGLAGAMVCMRVPGSGGLVWPPQVAAAHNQEPIEDQLIDRALSWLRHGGGKLAQALLIPGESALAVPLKRNGFVHVTNLWYMRHQLNLPTAVLFEELNLVYQTYSQCGRAQFHETLLRSYEETRDCPEVNGVRTIEEIIEGHQAQGKYDPNRWWLALDVDRPIGVLLLTRAEEGSSWDISYLGIVPEARRRGFGRELTVKALQQARAAQAEQLTLSVDVRNRSAWNLYRGLGFEAFEQREVYLAIWNRTARH